MKKTYFSTFTPGMEELVEAMLHKEGGVAVERMLPGAALYRSVREPELPYMRRTFSVLFQMKPVAGVDDAVKRLLSADGWLDRFPYETADKPRFRIVTALGDQLVGANMRQVDRLERLICEQTGMRVQRERPDVELWVLCRPEAAYFLWRMNSREDSKAPDKPRKDICAAVAFLLKPEAQNTVVLHCQGAALPAALRRCGARVTCLCPNAALVESISRAAGSGVRVLVSSAGYTGLSAESQLAAALYLPPNDERTSQDEMRGLIFEAGRLLAPGGRFALIAPLDPVEETLGRAKGFRIDARYPLTLSGRKCALWLLERAREREEDSRE